MRVSRGGGLVGGACLLLVAARCATASCWPARCTGLHLKSPEMCVSFLVLFKLSWLHTPLCNTTPLTPPCLVCAVRTSPQKTTQASISTVSSLLLPRFVRKALLNLVMRPFEDPAAAIHEDVWLLRHSPLMPADIPIHGLVSEFESGGRPGVD